MGLENLDRKEVVRIGVVADTHVPDRKKELHPQIKQLFFENEVDFIVHTGDLSTSQVITALEEIAPVYAVRGNRDWWTLRNLPKEKTISIFGLKIFIAHGQGTLLRYFTDKIPTLFLGYKFERILRNFSEISEDIDIVLFGHSHRSEMRWLNGRLYFNPGSASDSGIDNSGPSVGLLEISSAGEINVKIVKLD